ncbi:MAG: hypothetical protein SF052_11175 [Bacteroidia bacterium]|nr:hypothetical protein [Bacteroidia bacterium]
MSFFPQSFRFHRVTGYHPEWIKASVSGGANPLETLPDGWRLWRDWHLVIAPGNRKEIEALESDEGRYLGYVRVVGRRQPEIQLEDPIVSMPNEYIKKPLLRQ